MTNTYVIDMLRIYTSKRLMRTHRSCSWFLHFVILKTYFNIIMYKSIIYKSMI